MTSSWLNAKCPKWNESMMDKDLERGEPFLKRLPSLKLSPLKPFRKRAEKQRQISLGDLSLLFCALCKSACRIERPLILKTNFGRADLA